MLEEGPHWILRDNFFLSEMYCVNVVNISCNSTFVIHVAIYNMINLLTSGTKSVSVARQRAPDDLSSWTGAHHKDNTS